MICICIHYYLINKIHKIKLNSQEGEGFQSQMLKKLVLELLVCCLTSLPNVNKTFSGKMLSGTFVYHISDIILMAMLLRVYLILRLYEHYSKWTSFKASNLCKKYGTTADAIFALKSDLKDRPFLTIGSVMVIIIIVLGIGVMESEKSFSSPSSAAHMDQLTNNEWLIVITMTTVGYGDYFPSTHIGRFFCIIACISGMILISALVVALNLANEFSKDQSIAYLAIKTKKREEEWYVSAAEVIKAAFRTKKPKDLTNKYKMMLNLRKTVFNFKRKTQLNSLMDISSAEMLYDLQHKLEEKLLATKTIICEIPRLEERCFHMKNTQKFLDEKIEKILAQQKVISKYLN